MPHLSMPEVAGIIRLRVGIAVAVSTACQVAGAALTPAEIQNLPHGEVEAALPNEQPSAFYGFAARLFQSSEKDNAVFWFYVGELRYRFYLQANPQLQAGGLPVYISINTTVGKDLIQYARGDVKQWIAAIDRALKWDEATPNNFTSKEKFPATYQEIRAGLERFRDQLATQPDLASTSELPHVSSIPTGTLSEGSLANAKLLEDVTKALFTNLQIPEQSWSTVKVARFVIQPPVGPTGKTTWREMWLVMKDQPAGRQYILTFQEDGSGSAHFRIEG